MSTDAKSSSREESGFYAAYAGFAKILRNWLIAYGVGCPVILLSNETIYKSLKETNCVCTAAVLFGIGVVSQLVAAMLYKTAMWWLYVGEVDTDFRERARYKSADWLSEQYWLEIVFDGVSIIFYVVGTAIVLPCL